MAPLPFFQNAEDFDSFLSGQIIFKRGDPGTVMYVIKSGEVELHIEDRVFATLSTGGILGEMALIDNQARSLTAIAKTDCQLVPVDQKRFNFLVQQNPFFAIEVMKIMSERLRAIHG